MVAGRNNKKMANCSLQYGGSGCFSQYNSTFSRELHSHTTMIEESTFRLYLDGLSLFGSVHQQNGFKITQYVTVVYSVSFHLKGFAKFTGIHRSGITAILYRLLPY